MSTTLAAPPSRLPVTPGRALAVGVVVLAVAGSTLSLGGLLVRQERTSTVALPAVRAVDVETGSGDVEVVGDATAGTRLERRETWSFSRPSRGEQVVDGVLRLRSRCVSWSSTCEVSYVVHVAAGTPVRMRTGSGTLRADGVGALDAESGSGDVEGSGLRGPVAARTGSGTVRLTAVEGGRVTARTGSGDLSVVLTGAPSEVTLQSGSGDLDVRVPDDGGAYAVSTRTGSGDADVRVRSDASAPRTITARTGSGDLSVAYARG